MSIPIKPQKLETKKSVEHALGGHEGRLEPKLDGWRLIAHINEAGECRLWNRAGNDMTHYLPEIVAELGGNLPADTILDGEAVSQGDNWCSVQSVLGGNPKKSATKREGIAFAVFDLLRFQGIELAPVTYEYRRESLEKVIGTWEWERVRLVPSFPATEENYEHIIDAGFEGAVVKQLDRCYRPGARGSGWYRLKPAPTMDVVAMGFEQGHGDRGSYRGLGAIVFGQYRDGELVKRARCGTGFSDAEAQRIWENQDEYLGKAFEIRYFGHVGKGVAPRSPSFRRWRNGEKAAEDCKWEELQR